jgi:hypothetical protein
MARPVEAFQPLGVTVHDAKEAPSTTTRRQPKERSAMKLKGKNQVIRRRKVWRTLIVILTLLATLAVSETAATSASAATPPSIAAVAYPASGTASVWGSGYSPYGEVHVWVYRNHQQSAYAVTHASANGSLYWGGTTTGYATCHDEFDVQAYDVATRQLTGNPFAVVSCAPNPNLTLGASYIGDYSARVTLTGLRFSAGAIVGIYLYRNHQFVNYFETIATSAGSLSTSESVPGQTYCNEELDAVAYDYTSHQFSNNPNAGIWCIW